MATVRPAPANIEQVRQMVAEEMTRLRDGISSPEQAKAMANTAGKVIAATALEMEYLRLSGRPMDIPFLNKPDTEPSA